MQIDSNIYSENRIDPYNPRKIPKSDPHSLIVPWCKKLDQYALPPQLNIPDDLTPHLRQNVDVDTLLYVCRTLDKDLELRKARLPKN